MENYINLIENNFEIFFLICFVWVITIVPIAMYFVTKKYFPLDSRNFPIDTNLMPEKTFSATMLSDFLQVKGPLLKLNFYADFIQIKIFDRFIIVDYSDEITIKEGIFWSKFCFKKNNLEYRVIPYSKEAIEYLKIKIGKI